MQLRAITAILGVIAGLVFVVYHVAFGLRGADPALASIMLVAEIFALVRGLSIVIRLAVARTNRERLPQLEASGHEAGDVIIKVDGHQLGQVRAAIIGAQDVWGVDRVVLAGRRSDAQILELLAREYRLVMVLDRTPERAVNAGCRALVGELVVVADADHVVFPDIFSWCLQMQPPRSNRLIGAYRANVEAHPDDAYGAIREVMSERLGRSGAALCSAGVTVYRRRVLLAAHGLRDGRDGGVVATTVALYRAGSDVVSIGASMSYQQTPPTSRSTLHARLIDSAAWARVFVTRLNPLVAPRLTSRQRLAALGAASDAVAPLGTMVGFVALIAALLTSRLPIHAPLGTICANGGVWVALSLLSRVLMFRGAIKPGDVGRGDFRSIGHTAKGLALGLFKREPVPLLNSGTERGGIKALGRHRSLLVGLLVLDGSVLCRIAAQHTKRLLTKVPRGHFLLLMAVAVFDMALMMSSAEFLMNRRQRRHSRRADVGFDLVVDDTHATARDLSPEGLGVHVTQHAALGASVVVRFRLPDLAGHFRDIALSALVTNVRAENDGWRLGLAFGAMTATDRDALIEYCRAVHPFDLARSEEVGGRSSSMTRLELAPVARSRGVRTIRALSWLTLIAVGAMNLPPYALAHAGPGNHRVSGMVFVDRNSNGKLDISKGIVASDTGQPGITVSGYDDGGWLVGRSITGIDGTFSIDHVGGPMRVELGPLPLGMYSSFPGQNGVGLTRFVDATSVDVKNIQFALSRPANYCQDNPDVIVSCFSGLGTSFGGSGDAVGVVPASTLSGASSGPLAASQTTSRSQVGVVAGVAYSPTDSSAYLAAWRTTNDPAAFASRTAVYRRDAQGVVSPFVTLPQRAAKVAYGPSSAGIGALALNADSTALLIANLDDNRLYSVPFASPDKVTSVVLPTTPKCPATDSVATALLNDGGDIYVVTQCTGASDSKSSSLSAAIFVLPKGQSEFDDRPIVWIDLSTAAAPTVVSTDRLERLSDRLQATNSLVEGSPNVLESTRRVPLTDSNRAESIASARRDRERLSSQIQAGIAAQDETRNANRISRVTKSRTAQLTKVDVSAGGKVQWAPWTPADDQPRTGQLEPLVVGMTFDGNAAVFDVRDRWGRPSLAAVTPAPTTNKAPSTTALKTSGAGESLIADPLTLAIRKFGLASLAALCDKAPTEAGGVIWDDADGNNRHDPSEAGLGGVTVKALDEAGNVVGTAITNDRGEYAFSSVSTEAPKGNSDNVGAGLKVGKPLTIVAGTVFDNAAGGALYGREISTSLRAIRQVLIPLVGANDFTADFGFTRPRNAVGNRVGRDLNADGVLTDNEPGIGGVEVALFESDVDGLAQRPIARQRTNPDGYYRFSGVPDGVYVATLVAADFAASSPLHGLVGSHLASIDNTVISKPFQVDPGDDGARARDVDFPMVPLTLTVRVFDDANRNGQFDADVENAFVGVHVTLSPLTPDAGAAAGGAAGAAGGVASTGNANATPATVIDDVATDAHGVAVLAPNGRGRFSVTAHGLGRDVTQAVDIATDQSTVKIDVPFVGAVDLAAGANAMVTNRIGTHQVTSVEISATNVGTVVALGGASIVTKFAQELKVQEADLAAAGRAGGATCTATQPGSVTCIFDDAPIAPGRRRSVVLPVQQPDVVPAAGPLTVEVLVNLSAADGVDLSTVNNSASTEVITPRAGVTLSVKAPAGPVDASKAFDVTLTATNNNATPAATGWSVSVPLVGFDEASAKGSGDGVQCSVTQHELVCSDTSKNEMAPGAHRDVQMSLLPSNPGANLSALAAFLRDGPNVPPVLTSRVLVNVLHRHIDLAVTARITPTAALAVNDVATMTISVRNQGIDAAESGFGVDISVPDGTTFIDATASGFSCTPTSTVPISVNCLDTSGTPIPAYKTGTDARTIAVRVKVTAPLTATSLARIQVHPAANDAPETLPLAGESPQNNNTVGVALSSSPHIDLGILATDHTPGIHLVGSRVVMDIMVFNDGDTAAKPGYAVTIKVPDAFNWVKGSSEAPSGFDCSVTAGVVSCVDVSASALAPGAQKNLALSFDVKSQSTGPNIFVATIAPLAGDIAESNGLVSSAATASEFSNNRSAVVVFAEQGVALSGVVTLEPVADAAAGISAHGATVTLTNQAGAEVARTTTNAAGGYVFTGVDASGAHSVRVVDGPGFGPTSKGSSVDVPASQGDKFDADLRAAVVPPTEVNDVVFSDRNANGTRDHDEPGVSGVGVNLLSSNGAKLSRAVTNALGQFRFTDLVPDAYRFKIEVPPRFLALPDSSPLALLPTPDASSDVIGATGIANQLVDSAFIDTNGDGVRQAGELPVSGHSIRVMSSDGVEVVSVPTDVNGNFRVRSSDVIGGLQAGATYEISVVLDDQDAKFLSSPTTIVTNADGIAKHLGVSHATLVPIDAIVARSHDVPRGAIVERPSQMTTRVSIDLAPLAPALKAGDVSPVTLQREVSATYRLTDVSAEGWTCSTASATLTCTPRPDLATRTGMLTVSLVNAPEATRRITRTAQLAATIGGVAVSVSAFGVAALLLFGVIRRWRQTLGSHRARLVS